MILISSFLELCEEVLSIGLDTFDILETYKTVLKSIGGDFIEVPNYDAIIDFVKKTYATEKRMITTIPELAEIASLDWFNDAPHSLEDVELTLVKAHFGVAENSALWVTDDILGQRVATFIPQYLAIIAIKKILWQRCIKRMSVSETKNTVLELSLLDHPKLLVLSNLWC